jgi:DNA-binding CsgD family transcriptional regulator
VETDSKDIAETLHITYGTLRWYLANIRKSYNVHSTRELLLVSGTPVSADMRIVKFSPRGKEVMELFMRGMTYKQIAERLGISLSGVNRHREKMLWQNECGSMLELVARYQAWLAESKSGDAL